jgi:transmembrane sensor
MSRATEISDTAAEWLIRLEGQTSPEIWDAFQSWMDSNPRHRAAFVRLRVGWNRVDLLKNMRPVDGTIDADLLAKGKGKVSPATMRARGLQPLSGAPRRRPEEISIPERRRVLAIAASIAVAGLVAWVGTYHLGWKSYETGIGGREEIALSDGSTVDLNTNTQLTTRITGSRRDIMLTRGEALFHVAHDSTRPFYVTAGGAVVRAVGTAFSVRIRDPEHIDVLVAEGRVAVGAPGSDANFENPTLLAAAQKVSAGEAASVRRNTVAVRRLQSDDVTRKLAWTGGQLDFRGETLEDAVQEFNRYNQRQITIADASILQLQMGGLFLVTDPDSFVAALRKSFGIQAQVGATNGDIRLTAGGKPP